MEDSPHSVTDDPMSFIQDLQHLGTYRLPVYPNLSPAGMRGGGREDGEDLLTMSIRRQSWMGHPTVPPGGTWIRWSTAYLQGVGSRDMYCQGWEPYLRFCSGPPAISPAHRSGHRSRPSKVVPGMNKLAINKSSRLLFTLGCRSI